MISRAICELDSQLDIKYSVFSQSNSSIRNNLFAGVKFIAPLAKDKIVAFVGGGETPVAPTNELRIWDNRDDKELAKVFR